MDGSTFDTLTRRLAASINRRAPRRGLLAGGFGALAAGLATGAADAGPGIEAKKEPCANPCGKACCTSTQVCQGTTCVAATRCKSVKAGIGGYCPKKATCCKKSRTNRNGGCCSKKNPVCCRSAEGCCPKKLPSCCADTETCCGKGATCCPKSAGGGCCPPTAPVCCQGSGQGKYCCPAGSTCGTTGCLPPGTVGGESIHPPVERAEHAGMSGRE